MQHAGLLLKVLHTRLCCMIWATSGCKNSYVLQGGQDNAIRRPREHSLFGVAEKRAPAPFRYILQHVDLKKAPTDLMIVALPSWPLQRHAGRQAKARDGLYLQL